MATGSKFVSNIKIWLFIVPVLMITVIPFIDREWIYTISQSEIDSNVYIFGLKRHENIQADTDEQFSRWFVSSGLFQSSTRQNKEKDNLRIAEETDNFTKGYFTNLWKMVYRAQYRLHVAWEWMLGAMLLIFAAMYDGWQQRNIKRHTFGYSNPMAFHLITHGMLTILGLAIALSFFPMSITPTVWIVGIMSVALLGWKMMESFQTGS